MFIDAWVGNVTTFRVGAILRRQASNKICRFTSLGEFLARFAVDDALERLNANLEMNLVPITFFDSERGFYGKLTNRAVGVNHRSAVGNALLDHFLNTARDSFFEFIS